MALKSRLSSASRSGTAQSGYQKIERDARNLLDPKKASIGQASKGGRTNTGEKSRASKSWREEKDALFVYKMDKYFEFEND